MSHHIPLAKDNPLLAAFAAASTAAVVSSAFCIHSSRVCIVKKSHIQTEFFLIVFPTASLFIPTTTLITHVPNSTTNNNSMADGGEPSIRYRAGRKKQPLLYASTLIEQPAGGASW